MDNKKINRINELYKKQKNIGLTSEEKTEQDLLRKEYISAIRGNFKSTMNTIKIKDEKGNIKELRKKD